MTVNRRIFLATTAATALAVPALGQTDQWDGVADAAAGLPQCRALMIHQSGQRVLAHVFRGPAMDRAVPIKSVSKTIVAALTGAALDRGELRSLDDPIGVVAPALIPRRADPRVAELTIADLVTMQAGLERTSGANYGAWVSSSDWVADALSRPFVAEPGSRMLYSTGSFHILGAILAEIAGQDLLSLARRRLGVPLGIEIPAWTRDPQGRYMGGNEMALTLEAMVRFGEMYRQSGQFGGQQVLSPAWVAKSFTPRTRSLFSGLKYGYGWFLGESGGIGYALARGYGGQIICVAPQIELTLALTSDPTLPARTGGYFGDLMRLIEGRILPVAKSQIA